MRVAKYPRYLTDSRPSLESRGFALTEAISKAEYLMTRPKHLEQRSIDQIRRLGEEVAFNLFNRGPYIVDFRFGVEKSHYDRCLHAVADTICRPVHVRETRHAIITDEALEWRPKLKRPKKRFEDRMSDELFSPRTKPSPPSSRATRFLAALKKAGTPLPYDGPRASDRCHTI